MKIGDKVKVVKGDYIGRIGVIKSKDHSHRNFGIKQYGLRFNIIEENGNRISVDANDVELMEEDKKEIIKEKVDDSET
jgi:hypothetical protein